MLPAPLPLLQDYPEPLTAEQRISLRRRTAVCVRRYQTVRRGARIIERGHTSLKSLLARLEEERDRLKAALERLTNPETTETTVTTTTINNNNDNNNNNNNEDNNNKDTSSGSNNNKDGNTEVKTRTPAGRRPGGLRLSAMFANMHSVLNEAKREQQQLRSNITLERERIGKTTQLKIVEDDIAQQLKHLDLLNDKYVKSQTLLKSEEEEVLEALRLYEEMQRMETTYASRFFLRASGSHEGNEDMDGASYDIFFTPAKYTDEVQEMIREQVEEVLEAYLMYRRRVDPVLEVLAEERRTREARRADQLLQLIGVDTGNTAVTADGNSDTSFIPQLTLATGGGSSSVYRKTTPMTNITTGDGVVNVTSALGNRNSVTVAGQISDVEEDNYDDDDDIGLGDDNNIGVGEVGEKRQRDQIQSALAALDDFEELY